MKREEANVEKNKVVVEQGRVCAEDADMNRKNGRKGGRGLAKWEQDRMIDWV